MVQPRWGWGHCWFRYCGVKPLRGKEPSPARQLASSPGGRGGEARRIEATDREIDGIVFELYGLTEEEIALVEEATK